MKIKTTELMGPALDWAVAKCEGALAPLGNVVLRDGKLVITVGGVDDPVVIYSPSTDRLQGEPIIERLGIVFASIREGRKITGWQAALKSGSKFGFDSPSTLVAAMRLCAENSLGPEVDVPDELYEKHAPHAECGPGA